MQSTGEKIKKIRINLGLNQEEFGKLFGVGKAYISQLEKDTSKLSYGNLVYLLLNYNVNLNWLLDENNIDEKQMFLSDEKTTQPTIPLGVFLKRVVKSHSFCMFEVYLKFIHYCPWDIYGTFLKFLCITL